MRLYFLYASIFLCAHTIYSSRIDSNAVALHKKKIDHLVNSRMRARDGLFYGGVCVAGLVILYTLYKNSSPEVDIPPSTFFEEHKQTLIDIMQRYHESNAAEAKVSFMYKGMNWLVKTGSAMVVQSVILRMLEPLYVRIKQYVIADVPLVTKNFWFLADSPTYGVAAQPITMLNKDIASFVTHVEGIGIAYRNHDSVLLHDSAAFIMAHLSHVLEEVTLYEEYRVKKVISELDQLFEALINDADAHVYNSALWDSITCCLRQLHRVSYYNHSD